MFYAKIKDKRFDRRVKVLTKKFGRLGNYKYFCSIDDADDNFVHSYTKILHQKLTARTAAIYFERRFTEEDNNSMDLVGGETYQAYLSYYLNTDKGYGIKYVAGDNDADGTNKPRF